MLAPIVLFVYNRPWHTRQTLEALEKNILADQSVLYIYADGPKTEDTGETLTKIAETRAVIREKTWCKEVFIIESDINKGLADSIVGGVTEIVNRYGKVIVLEDDIVTSKGFLRYMNDALELYEREEKVMHISGYMFPVKQQLPETFFYNTASCWGWATWKRAWNYFNNDAKELLFLIDSKFSIKKFNIENTYDFYAHLKANAEGAMKTWAVRWYASFFIRKGYALHPGKSLVLNIGLDGSGQHSGVAKQFIVKYLADSISVKMIKIIESKQARKAMAEFNLSFQKNKIQKKNSTVSKLSSYVPLRIKKSLYVLLYPNAKTKKAPLSAEELEKKRIQSLPRFQSASTNLLGKPLRMLDAASFLFLYNEIFSLEIYKFKNTSDQPYIIDCGANIGLSIIYFKTLYPNASVIGFEPDKKVFEILSQNITAFQFTDVKLINQGLWHEETVLNFFSEGADGGRVALKADKENIVQIHTTRLRKFLDKPVDLLKIDIEGAEVEVLEESKDKLYLVKNLFVEYHSFVDKPQALDKLLGILSATGFRYYIGYSGIHSPHPFCHKNTYLNMDNQLNIYATR